MMGRQAGDQARLFYSLNPEERIPARHLLRRMNTYVTSALADLHRELAGTPADPRSTLNRCRGC